MHKIPWLYSHGLRMIQRASGTKNGTNNDKCRSIRTLDEHESMYVGPLCSELWVLGRRTLFDWFLFRASVGIYRQENIEHSLSPSLASIEQLRIHPPRA